MEFPATKSGNTLGSGLNVQNHHDANSSMAERTSITYTIDRTKRMVSVKFGNALSARDIVNYASSLRDNPLFEPDFSELVDLRNVEQLPMDAEQALKLADEIDPFSLGAKRAFVAQKSAAIYAARMHMLLRNENRNIRIFESMEEATQWLQS